MSVQESDADLDGGTDAGGVVGEEERGEEVDSVEETGESAEGGVRQPAHGQLESAGQDRVHGGQGEGHTQHDHADETGTAQGELGTAAEEGDSGVRAVQVGHRQDGVADRSERAQGGDRAGDRGE